MMAKAQEQMQDPQLKEEEIKGVVDELQAIIRDMAKDRQGPTDSKSQQTIDRLSAIVSKFETEEEKIRREQPSRTSRGGE
jgi:hypothetical protein